MIECDAVVVSPRFRYRKSIVECRLIWCLILQSVVIGVQYVVFELMSYAGLLLSLIWLPS